MKRVYIAGPYSDDNVLGVLKNIGRGEYWGAKLFKEGFAPFVPWLDRAFVLVNWDVELTVHAFYEYSMEWLKVSDAVFVVPDREGLKSSEDSFGTQKELEVARTLNIPIFYDIQYLKEWAQKN